jgi:hypothetical protein
MASSAYVTIDGAVAVHVSVLTLTLQTSGVWLPLSTWKLNDLLGGVLPLRVTVAVSAVVALP